MNTNNNFEIKYTIRLYEPALISELAAQHEKTRTSFKHKNEFLTHIIELGLKANRNEMKSNGKNAESEENDIYALLLKIFNYTSTQFRKIYIDINVLQRLLSVSYKMLLSLNADEKLNAKKVEDGFYDDLPERFAEIVEQLIKVYGLK